MMGKDQIILINRATYSRRYTLLYITKKAFFHGMRVMFLYGGALIRVLFYSPAN